MVGFSFLEDSDLVLFLDQFGVNGVLFGEVAVTFDLCFFDEVAQHEDRFYVVFLDHSPEVVEGYRQRALGGDGFLPVYVYKVRIYIVLDLVSVFRRA